MFVCFNELLIRLKTNEIMIRRINQENEILLKRINQENEIQLTKLHGHKYF